MVLGSDIGLFCFPILFFKLNTFEFLFKFLLRLLILLRYHFVICLDLLVESFELAHFVEKQTFDVKEVLLKISFNRFNALLKRPFDVFAECFEYFQVNFLCRSNFEDTIVGSY